MLAVVGELDPGHELGVADHGGHALSRGVVVHAEALVRAGGGRVHAAAVQHHLDEGPVLAGGALEGPEKKERR